MHRPFLRIFLLFAAIGLLAGCSPGGDPPLPPTAAPPPTPTVAPTPTPTPAEISAQIGKATAAAQSFHFEIGLAGQPIFADDSKLFAITSIIGDLKRPDAVLATIKLGNGGGTTEIKSVSLGGRQYITNPITRAWQCLPPAAAFDPAVLFDASKGIEFLLQRGVADLTLAGTEDLNGQPNYHLRGTIPGELLQTISGGRFGAGPAKLDLWASIATRQLTQLRLVDSATGAANPTSWTVQFSDYDKPFDVQAPPGATCP